MKKKLSSILGVGLALVLVFTLAGAFLPANNEAEAQAWTPNQFNAMPIPTGAGRVLVPGSNIADFCVASNGTTIYLVDNTSWGVAKSTNGGRTFNWLFGVGPAGISAPPGAWGAGDLPKLVAVAPDDPETVAIVEDTTGAGVSDIVWISTTGGATWANLLAPTAVATEFISGIAVGPARAGTILGRDYVVCTYNTLALPVNTGDIYQCGSSTTWTSVAVAAGVAMDFSSLTLAPNWVGERAVIAIGSNELPAGNSGMEPPAGIATVGDSYLVPINANPIVGPVVCGPGTVLLECGSHDSPAEVTALWPATDGEIFSSSVVLPADFDSTSVGFFKAYVGWSSTVNAGAILCGDDVYRVDFNTVRKLEIRPVLAIASVDYSGTCQAGTLFAGENDSNGIWFTSEPMSGMPTWGFSYKSPTSSAPAFAFNNAHNTMVALTPDFESSNVVYGACGSGAGTDQAFSKSEDGGLSFNGISFIDEAIAVINDVMPTPSGEYVFMATEDAVGPPPNHSLWRCPGEPAAARWDRVHFRTLAQFPSVGTIVRISPDWVDDSTLYWFDFGGVTIRRSTNNGQIWGARTAAAAVQDATIESKDILYMISGANCYASSNGGWFFGLPVSPGLGGLNSIAMAPSYPQKPVPDNLLVGSAATGRVALSTNGGAGFRPLLQFNIIAGNVSVQADMGYADNNIVYCASDAVGGAVYRYEVGVSTAWETIRGAAGTAGGANAQFSGLGMHCGKLYASWFGGAAGFFSGAERAMFPTAPAPLWTWDSMDVGAALATFTTAPSALRVCGTDTDVWLYAIDTTGAGTLFAYRDTMAKAAAEPVVPAKVNYDPNVFGSRQFTISWNQISNALGWQAEIYRDAGCTELVLSVGAAAPFFVPANPAAPAWVIVGGALAAGEIYYFKVRARNQVPGDAIRSNWSEVIEFAVEAGVPITVEYPSPELLGPLPGATSASVTPGFSWGAYHGAVKYEFELSTDPGVTARGYFVDALVGLTGENALVTTAWQCDIDLDYDTNYYWHVKAIQAEGETPWSTGLFTTLSEAEIPAPPLPPVELPAPITPAWIWAIVAIGAILVIVVIVLIFVTRKP